MKRILKFGGALLALGMLLASCNMLTSDSTVSGNSTEQESSNINGITIGVKSIDNSRTILPADWTNTTASALTYVLLGKKHGTDGWDKKGTFDYSQLTGGTATVNLDLIEWDLKLIGYITDKDYTTHPCLEKEETVDLSQGIKTVTFDLKPVVNADGEEAATQATGKVDVTIEWLTEQPKRLEFGIYDIGKKTDEIVEDIGRDKAKFFAIKKDASFAVAGIAHIMSWDEATTVPAGMYKFAAVFYNEEAERKGDVIGYYIDYLYVDGGNLSKATVPYGDKFNTIPDNPTWLAVETVFVPQELTDPDTDVNDWYYAKFHWNDISNNETGFELVINDGEKDYIFNPTTNTDGLISDKWYNGPGIEDTTFTTTNPNTLDAGRTWVVLKLKTQTLYTAKIRAINKYTPDFDDADDDDFCENLNRNGDGQGRSYAPIVTNGTGTTAKKQFGMFTVNYDLAGGVVTKAVGTKTDDDVTNYVVGFNYSSQSQDLMTDNETDYPHIKKTATNFDHWEDKTPKRLDKIPAKQKDNLELTAVWVGSVFNVRVTFPSYADADEVPISETKNTRNTIPFKYNKLNPSSDDNAITLNANKSLKNTKFELSAMGEDGKIIATVAEAGPEAVSDPDGVYGTIKLTSATKEWTWKPTEKTLPGFYCLQITGDYEDAGSGITLTLCGNIYINVEN